MPSYNESKIYKIECITGEGQCYVGSTTKVYLSQRMEGHRNSYKRWKAGKAGHVKSYDLFDLYGLENCKILLLENVNAESKDELLAREAYYIRSLDCVNKVIPGQTQKEYRDTHKEERKEYNEIHKDKLSKQSKEYKDTHKEEIKEKMKERYISNKDKQLAYSKQYYQKKKLLKQQLLEAIPLDALDV